MKTLMFTLSVLVVVIFAFSACTPEAEPVLEAAPQEAAQNTVSEAPAKEPEEKPVEEPVAEPVEEPVEEPAPDLEKLARDLNDAFNEGDVAAVKALYGPNAAVCFPDWGEECTSGEEDVGQWVEELVGLNFEIEPQSYQVDGEKVSVIAKVWADPSRELGIAPLVTNDVYTFEDGLIINQTSTLDEESAAKLATAMAEMQALEIITAANEAWNAGDVDTLKALYATDGEMCAPDWGPDCNTGEEELAEWIEGLVGVNFLIEPQSFEAEGNIVTVVAKVWADPSRALEIAPLVTTDVYTLKDGQILNQTSTLDEESAAKLAAAMEALEEPAAEGSAPPVPLAASAEEILGAWKWTGGDFSVRFDNDGTARMAYKPDELQGAPFYTFSYVFDGPRMEIREIAGYGVESCGSTVDSYEIQLLESGNIQIVVIEDDCGRAGDIPGEYEPLPGS